MKIWCATGNAGKLREFRLAGEVLGIEIEPLAGLKSLVAPEELQHMNLIEKRLGRRLPHLDAGDMDFE